MTLDELIAALEAATSLDWKLDAAIGKIVLPSSMHPRVWYDESDGGPVSNGKYWPLYTSSIEAALSLVPENHSWVLGCLPDAMVWPTGGVCSPFRSGGATPAIALCIAALKARKAIENEV